MMQWTPYGGTVDEFLDHIRTFGAVFPHVIVAFGPGGYGFFLIGSDQPLQFTDENIRNVLPGPASSRTSRPPTTHPSRRSTAGPSGSRS
jgi:hypothetical protein